MTAAIDTSNDGRVDFEEFQTFFALHPMASLEQIMAQWADVGALDTGSDLVPAVSTGPATIFFVQIRSSPPLIFFGS